MAKKPEQRAQLAVANVEWKYRKDGSIWWTYTPPQKGTTAWSPIWCAGFEVDEHGKKQYHHLEAIPCHCPPGPQYLALNATAFEVALAGGRGSAKSEATFGFLLKGNPITSRDGASGLDASYIACPDYRALVLRKNLKDLEDYFSRACKFFDRLGGIPVESPTRKVKFPSGAYIIFDHLSDSNAYEKYQGQEFARVIIEEATQIPEEMLYMQVQMSCRTSHPQLRNQIMLTANPGGPGARWFNARFVDLKREDGSPVSYGEVYTDPLIDDPHLATRVLIHSRVDDNPFQLAKGYDKQLDHLKRTQPTLWKRWRMGDMTAIEGAYFECFRPKALPNEPPNALHVVKPINLDNYWPRAIGCDWGYSHPSAVYWGCWHPSGQLHVYRELVTARTGAVELGAMIARQSLPELQRMANPHMNLWLSHDAFARTSETATEAEQVAAGIGMILGPDAAFVVAPDLSEELLENESAWMSVRQRQQERSRKTHITLVNADLKRRGNMSRIRDYLRWWPIEVEGCVWDEDIARRIVQFEGALAYMDYKRSCEKQSLEALPKLLIHEGCEQLIVALQAATEAENDSEQMAKVDGDDPVDALAYLVGNFPFSTAEMPTDRMIAEKLNLLREQMPGLSTQSLIMASRYQEQKAAQRTGHAYMLPRRGASRRGTVN